MQVIQLIKKSQTNFVSAGKILRKKIKEKRQISHLMISLSQDYISLISGSLLGEQEVHLRTLQNVSQINSILSPY